MTPRTPLTKPANTVAGLSFRRARHWSALLLALAGVAQPFTTSAGEVAHGIVAGLVDAAQNPAFNPAEPGADDNTNVLASLRFSINDFRLGSYNRADLNTQIGPDPADDATAGVFITRVAENGRNNYGSNAYPTSAFAVNAGRTYRFVSFIATAQAAGSAAEYNVNLAGAWFPWSTPTTKRASL